MAEPPPVTFAGLLRKLRTEAGLTQEQLAEAADLSPRAVSDLERGINLTARKQTTRLLADALGLTGAVRTQFEAVARGRARPTSTTVPISAADRGRAVGTTAAGATRTLPRDIASFTGRQPELQQLVGAAASGGIVGIHAIGGMAGIGKTAFAVHAAHASRPFPGRADLLAAARAYSRGNGRWVRRMRWPACSDGWSRRRADPAGLEARMALWRDRLAGKQLLLVLDDAADSEQVWPLLPGGAREHGAGHQPQAPDRAGRRPDDQPGHPPAR